MARHHHVHKIHKKKPKDPLDYMVYFFTVATPMFEVPQAWQIHKHQSAANISTVMWSFFLFADIVWFIYAIRHKIKPLMVMYTFYLIVEGSIVMGIIMYS